MTSSVSCSEDLKEADSVKTRSLQALKDENNKLTQELDHSHTGQSELTKVEHALIFLFYSDVHTECTVDLLTAASSFFFHSSGTITQNSRISWKRVNKGYFFPSFILSYISVCEGSFPVDFTFSILLFLPSKPPT